MGDAAAGSTGAFATRLTGPLGRFWRIIVGSDKLGFAILMRGLHLTPLTRAFLLSPAGCCIASNAPIPLPHGKNDNVPLFLSH